MRTPKTPKLFKSLNCATCESPFSPTAEDPRSPRNVNCGLSVCQECYETEQFPKKHPHYKKHKCSSRSGCFNNPNPAHFIIEILSSNSFTLSPDQNGYILSEDFPDPKCGVCHVEYTINERKPAFLFCNHMLCYCCLRDRWTEIGDHQFPYIVSCPQCNEETHYGVFNDGQAIDFLRELPSMREQMIRLKEFNQIECKDCERKTDLNDIFTCTDCKYQCCGSCGIRKHKDHTLVEFTNQFSPQNLETRKRKRRNF